MTNEEKAIKRQAKMTTHLYEAMGDTASIAQKARTLAETLYATGHNEHLPEKLMLQTLLIMSGSAVAILYQCAKTIDELKGKVDA